MRIISKLTPEQQLEIKKVSLETRKEVKKKWKELTKKLEAPEIPVEQRVVTVANMQRFALDQGVYEEMQAILDQSRQRRRQDGLYDPQNDTVTEDEWVEYHMELFNDVIRKSIS